MPKQWIRHFRKCWHFSLNVITRTADHAQCQMQTLASSVCNHNHHLQFYIVLYNIYILDKSIGLWWVIWWRQWCEGNKYNCALSLALCRESQVSVSSAASVTQRSLQQIHFPFSCRAQESAFRSTLGFHSLLWKSTACFHVWRPFNCPSLATSRHHLLEACFCYRQGARWMLGSVASELYVR